MKLLLKFGLGVFVSTLLTTTASASNITMNLSTGLDASNNIITVGGTNDAHWNVVSTNLPAKVLTPSVSDWWGGWPANDANSTWIARDPNNIDNGVGTYQRTFDLTGVNLATVQILGNWAVDDEGTLSLNGHQIGLYQPHDGWQNFATQTFLMNNQNWLTQGINTLTLNIAATDDFFEGVRLNASLTGSTGVTTPEPGTMCAMLCPVAAALLRRSRRNAV